MKSDQSHSFSQVTVIGDHHGAVVSIKPCVIQQMHRKVDIGAFLLCLDHRFEGPALCGLGQRCSNFAAQEVSVVDGYLRNVSPQCTEISLLPQRFVRILRGRGNQGGEIVYAGDHMRGLEDLAEERLQVQPFVRCASYGSVIKIEPIDVNGCSHHLSHKKAGAPEGAPRPRVETLGGATISASFHGIYKQSAVALQQEICKQYTASSLAPTAKKSGMGWLGSRLYELHCSLCHAGVPKKSTHELRGLKYWQLTHVLTKDSSRRRNPWARDSRLRTFRAPWCFGAAAHLSVGLRHDVA